MDIAVCLDHNFVMPTGVMLYSLCVNNPNTDINIHAIIDGSVTDKDKQDLEFTMSSFVGTNITFYYVNSEIYQHYPALGNRYNITQACYYRLLLAEILPQTIDKILYLDGDVIVRESLLPLWNTDISQYAVAAVHDCLEEMTWRFDYPTQFGYFNSGVLLVNLYFWRSRHVNDEFESFVHDHREKIIAHDQDVLNYVFYKQKLFLPIRYNLQSGFFLLKTKKYLQKMENEVREAYEHPAIIHYNNPLFKPWSSYTKRANPYSSTFLKYQHHTIWKDWPKEDDRPIKLRVVNYIADMLRYMRIVPNNPDFDLIDLSPID